MAERLSLEAELSRPLAIERHTLVGGFGSSVGSWASFLSARRSVWRRLSISACSWEPCLRRPRQPSWPSLVSACASRSARRCGPLLSARRRAWRRLSISACGARRRVCGGRASRAGRASPRPARAVVRRACGPVRAAARRASRTRAAARAWSSASGSAAEVASARAIRAGGVGAVGFAAVCFPLERLGCEVEAGLCPGAGAGDVAPLLRVRPGRGAGRRRARRWRPGRRGR